MKFKKAVCLLLTLVMITALAAVAPSAQAYTGGKLVALTFDDGPGPYTQRLLDGLKERGVKATFFMVGQNIARYPETVKRMYAEGHQLANHSYDHPNLVNLSDSSVHSQIDRTISLLDNAAGKGSNYMVRAPYGSTNARVRSLISSPLIYWSVDPQDWKDRNASTVKNRVVNNAHDGAIILLHDIHSTSVDGALAAIDILKSDGYEFVTVSELFRRRGITPSSGVSYSKCSPTGTDSGPVTAPVISGKSENGKITITITAQKGADIYYSTKSSSLNQESTRYTGPITVTPPCTIWAAAAYNMNGSRSETVSQTFTKLSSSPPSISISDDGTMTLTNKTAGTDMFYTLDGTSPDTGSSLYTAPVSIAPGTVVSACAGGTDYYTSAVSKAVYSHLGHFFKDVFPDKWYYSAMDQAVDAGYLMGMGSGIYSPEGKLTRGQLVTLLFRVSGDDALSQQPESCPFTDVQEGEYYTQAVCWAYKNGIAGGYEDGTFRPGKYVTRQEMAKFFVTYIEHMGKQLPSGADITGKFSDYDDINSWAIAYVSSAVSCRLMRGDDLGQFRPVSSATRAQCAAMLLRLDDILNSLPESPDKPENPVAPKPEQPTLPQEPAQPVIPPEYQEPADSVPLPEVTIPDVPGQEPDLPA